MKNEKIIFGLIILATLIYLSRDILGYAFATATSSSNTRSRSDTEMDAKEIGTYICSIKPTFKRIHNGLMFETKGGWLEKKWWGDNRKVSILIPDRYDINLIPKGHCWNFKALTICGSSKKELLEYSSPIYYSEIDSSLKSDSIKYYILNEPADSFDRRSFDENHIIDSFYIILDRKKD